METPLGEHTIRTIVVGTRGSALALTQTQLVVDALRRAQPPLSFEIQTIKTEGDRLANVSLSKIGGQGVFVKEIERALLDGTIDLAVHSLKDLPSTLPPGLTIAAVPEREDARDVLISRGSHTLATLPPGATLATSSPRRFAQLQAARPDLRFVDLRGNVDTRLRRLHAGDFDAIVIAAAGVLRLGRGAEVVEYLPPDVCLPSVGQGALAIETRVDDDELLALLQNLDHPTTLAAVTAERAFLRALGGGCRVPIAAYAEIASLGDGNVGVGHVGDGNGVTLHLHGRILAPDGSQRVDGARVGHTTAAEELGADLGAALLVQARALLDPAAFDGQLQDLLTSAPTGRGYGDVPQESPAPGPSVHRAASPDPDGTCTSAPSGRGFGGVPQESPAPGPSMHLPKSPDPDGTCTSAEQEA